MKLQQLIGRFAHLKEGKANHFFLYTWISILYAGGAAYWLHLLDWGNPASFLLHDWYDITYPRLSILQSAFRQGILPLFSADPTTLQGITRRFLTFPDLLLSPQVALLLWMNVIPFIVVNLLFSYAIGGAGLAALARKFKLSPLAFTFLFLFFNFNGYIVSHFTVGHYTWTAYYILPWFFLLAFQAVEREKLGWSWIAWTAVVMVAIVLQGGYHFFIWCLFFLGLIIVARPKHCGAIVLAGLFSVLLNAFRLAPLVLNLSKFKNIFITGYANITAIWDALTVPYLPQTVIPTGSADNVIGAWEYTLYVGLIGAAFLFLFGIGSTLYRGFRAPKNRGQKTGSAQESAQVHYAALLIPALGLALLSLTEVFKNLRIGLPLPVFTGERVATRMIVLAFLTFAFLAVIEYQRWLDRRPTTLLTLAGSCCVLLLLVYDFYRNTRFWQLRYAISVMEDKNFSQIDQKAYLVSDPAYVTVLWVGLGISLATLAFLTWKGLKEARREHKFNQQSEAKLRRSVV